MTITEWIADRRALEGDMLGRDASEGSTLNPYHTEETDHA